MVVNESRPWWLWPNLLSLDAPAVAVVWQSLFAAEEGIALPTAAVAALSLTVWGIYLADRWFDVRDGRHSPTDRHRFVAENRRTVAISATIILTAAGMIALLGLPTAYLEAGGMIALISTGYFAVIHALAHRSLNKGLKEVSVGAVFALGVAIPLMLGTARLGTQSVSGVIGFGGLCAMNCLLISRWEEKPFTAPAAWTVAAAGSVAFAASFGATTPVALAVWSSLVLLIGLNAMRARISPRGLRVLVDAALLSPLVAVVFA